MSDGTKIKVVILAENGITIGPVNREFQAPTRALESFVNFLENDLKTNPVALAFRLGQLQDRVSNKNLLRPINKLMGYWKEFVQSRKDR